MLMMLGRFGGLGMVGLFGGFGNIDFCARDLQARSMMFQLHFFSNGSSFHCFWTRHLLSCRAGGEDSVAEITVQNVLQGCTGQHPVWSCSFNMLQRSASVWFRSLQAVGLQFPMLGPAAAAMCAGFCVCLHYMILNLACRLWRGRLRHAWSRPCLPLSAKQNLRD